MRTCFKAFSTLIDAVRNAVGIWWRDLQSHEAVVSGGKVNWLTDEVFSERLPAINFAHVDLTGREQRPEQHGGGVYRQQHGLSFDPPLELFVQTFDLIRCPRVAPLARRQSCEGEQPVASFLQAVGDGGGATRLAGDGSGLRI